MQLVCVSLLFIVRLAATHETTACEPDAEALIQHSLAVISENDAKDAHESHMSGEQLRLHSELQSARKARQAVLASLQQWDQRISALEKVVDSPALPLAPAPAPKAAKDSPVQAILHERKMAEVVVLSVLIVLIVLYMIRTVSQYEANREKEDLPWYHDSLCMEKLLAAGGLLWLMLGISMFTQFILFTDAHRHLSVIESIYLTSQIVTTVGYGDLTPTTDAGKLLMVLYAVTGVTVIGALMQQLLLSSVDPDETHVVHSTPASSPILGKNHTSILMRIMHVLPVLACVVFGTMFYSLYPGENKSTFEAFYMTIISLLTIGFGAYHPNTEAGKLVGSVWLLVGVAYVGQVVVDCTQSMAEKRHTLRVKASSMRLFADLDKDNSGSIDRMEFLQFELVRAGVPKSTTEKANKTFDGLDSDGNGTLDCEEFEKYVASL